MMFKNIFKDKSGGFYFTLVTFALALITSIVYVAFFASSEMMSWGVFVCALLPIVVFVALALLGAPKIGATISALLTFVAFVLLLISVYGYIWDSVNTIAMGGEITSEFIHVAVCLGMLLITVIFANVCVWIRYTKRPNKTKRAGKEVNNG